MLKKSGALEVAPKKLPCPSHYIVVPIASQSFSDDNGKIMFWKMPKKRVRWIQVMQNQIQVIKGTKSALQSAPTQTSQ